jgi:hypothetical protein
MMRFSTAHHALGAALLFGACVLPSGNATAAGPSAALEDIYVLRSIREPHQPRDGWCAAAKTGFAPFPTDAERRFSFWSVATSPASGKLVDARQQQVAELHACFGPTEERARQHFYAEIRLGALSFRGNGECLALNVDFPEPGLFPVRCQLILSDMPVPFVGGLLTTNTLTSGAAFGGETEPPGYTQASIATIRLWRTRPADLPQASSH